MTWPPSEGWSHRLSNGMWAWSHGATWSVPQWRVQVYWPEVRVERGHLHIRCATVFRVLWRHRECGFGVQAFGFGFGVAWEAPGVVVAPPSATEE